MKFKNRRLSQILPRTFVLGGVILMAGCALLPGSGPDEPVAQDQVPEVIPTETNTAPPTQIPTQTRPPTQTMLPTETLSPTPRPSWTPFPTKTLRPTWTPSPTLSPTATRDIGWIIKDDFSEKSLNWLVSEGGNWKVGFDRSAYVLEIKSRNVEITSAQSGLHLGDTRVIADVFRDGGAGYWGISCREVVYSSYYTIFITSDGEFGWGETRSGKVELHILGTSDLIKTGRGRDNTNHIIADCRGNTLALYVDGVMLFQTEIEGIGPGWVGMMAGTQYHQDNVEVFFDSIEIWGPLLDE